MLDVTPMSLDQRDSPRPTPTLKDADRLLAGADIGATVVIRPQPTVVTALVIGAIARPGRCRTDYGNGESLLSAGRSLATNAAAIRSDLVSRRIHCIRLVFWTAQAVTRRDLVVISRP